MNMIMAKGFEDRFFELLQNGLDDFKGDIRSDLKDMSREVKANTKITEKLSNRVDKLDGKVFGKKVNSLTTLFGDRQIILAFAFALLVFLLILASVLKVKIPNL